MLTQMDRYIEDLAHKTRPAEMVLRRQVEDIEDDFTNDDEYEEAMLEAVDAASRVFHVADQAETATG